MPLGGRLHISTTGHAHEHSPPQPPERVDSVQTTGGAGVIVRSLLLLAVSSGLVLFMARRGRSCRLRIKQWAIHMGVARQHSRVSTAECPEDEFDEGYDLNGGEVVAWELEEDRFYEGDGRNEVADGVTPSGPSDGDNMPSPLSIKPTSCAPPPAGDDHKHSVPQLEPPPRSDLANAVPPPGAAKQSDAAVSFCARKAPKGVRFSATEPSDVMLLHRPDTGAGVHMDD